MAHTLNVRGVYASTCPWQLLLHGGLVTPHYSKAQLAQLVHRISDSMHCDVPLHTQLKILTWAKKHFAGPLQKGCFQKVAYRVQQHTGLSLPHHVPVHVPTMTHLDAFTLRDTCKRLLRFLPLPVHLPNYLVQVTRIVPVRDPTVADLLRDDSKYDTIQELRDQAEPPPVTVPDTWVSPWWTATCSSATLAAKNIGSTREFAAATR